MSCSAWNDGSTLMGRMGKSSSQAVAAAQLALWANDSAPGVPPSLAETAERKPRQVVFADGEGPDTQKSTCVGCLDQPWPNCAVCDDPAVVAVVADANHSLSLCCRCHDELVALRPPKCEPPTYVPMRRQSADAATFHQRACRSHSIGVA